MSWQFFIGTLDKEHQSFRNTLFGLACDPDKLLTMKDGNFLTMMDGLDVRDQNLYMKASSSA